MSYLNRNKRIFIRDSIRKKLYCFHALLAAEATLIAAFLLLDRHYHIHISISKSNNFANSGKYPKMDVSIAFCDFEGLSILFD